MLGFRVLEAPVASIDPPAGAAPLASSAHGRVPTMCWLCTNDDHQLAQAFSSTVSAPAGAVSLPVLTLDAIVAQLRTSWGRSWENETYPRIGTTVAYAALTSTPNDPSPENGGFTAMTPLMAARAGEAFELWDDLVAIALTPYVGNPPAGAPIIQLAYSSTTEGGRTYQRAVDGSELGPNAYGGTSWGVTRNEIWLSSLWSTQDTTSALNRPGHGYYGGYGFATYLHEIGHALGLSHPGSYNAGKIMPTYAGNAEYAQDTLRYTVMSYFDAASDGSGTDHVPEGRIESRYPQTPMLHDIAAVQAIYGADTTTRAGNTTYGFNSTAGKDVYDFTKNTSPVIAIYDAGGNDTLDLSGFGAGSDRGQSVDLTPGSYSSVGGAMSNNLAIAFNTVIENAIGGSGDDILVGNAVANRLKGGPGNDTIYGGDGNDTLEGGVGADRLDGQGGADTFVFATLTDGGDVLVDVTPDDRIALKASGFALATGSLATAGVAFASAARATTAGPSLFIDPASDRLFFDADGIGAGAPVGLATLAWSAGRPSSLGSVGPRVDFETTGDFDGDGLFDLLWRDLSTGEAHVWTLGTGGVVSRTTVATVSSAYAVVGTGDFDGNGTSDVLWRNPTTGHTGAWLMRGGKPTDWLDLGTVASPWTVSGTGDFDGNGIDDVLWSNRTTQKAGAWLMSPGAPRDWLDLGSLNGWQVTGTGDFNADGLDDVLFANATTREVGAWRINNGRPGGWWEIGTLEAGWAIDAVADLDGDGIVDIHLRDASAGAAKGWRIDGGVLVGTLAQPALGRDWTVVGAGPLDRAAGADLVWHNAVTGAVIANGEALTVGNFLVVA
jgi:hypothetical protein